MDSLFWLCLNFATILFLAFFSMAEMAIISANPIRLEFKASQEISSAKMILALLQKPSRLFATTLICVNIFMMAGSEFSREFHQSIGLSPDLAPLSQIIIVILFGELVPQFAARRFSDSVALFCAPIVYATSRLLAPFVALLEGLTQFINFLTGMKEKTHQFLMTQEEIEKILGDEEKSSENLPSHEKSDLETMASRLFKLKGLTAASAMHPIKSFPLFPATSTVYELRAALKPQDKWVILYGKEADNVLGIVYIRTLIKSTDGKKLRDFLIKPWYITEETPLTSLLTSFRRNSENVAFIVNSQGKIIGLLTLDHILDLLYGKSLHKSPMKIVVDVTVDGSLPLSAFDAQFSTTLAKSGLPTLSNYLHSKFPEPPQAGDALRIPPYELIIKECSMTSITKVHVKTLAK